MDNPKKGWIPNCKESHQLISERMDRNLGIIENTGLRIHLMVCVACTNLTQQMDFLRNAMKNMPLDEMPLDELPLNSPGKEDEKPK